MSDEYDLAVIGAGSAGLSAAGFAVRLGARTALVEAERIGGDCTWTGCVPSKALLHVGRIAHEMRTAGLYGLPSCERGIDLRAVLIAVREAVARVYELESPERLRAAGLEVRLGAARFIDPHTVEIEGEGRLRAKHFLLCTGARPSLPAVPGLEAVPHVTYRDVWDLTELPRRLAVLGGGPTGCELGQAFQRLGSQVTLLEAAAHLLPGTEPAAGELLRAVFGSEGMDVRLATSVQSAAVGQVGLRLSTTTGEIETDTLLVAAGRTPFTAGLDLHRAGVELTGAAVKVDGKLQTSQPHIYAAGDVTGSFQFTHYAGWQAVQAVRNILLPGGVQGTRAAVPWAVFTDPEVAQVGELRGSCREWPVARVDRAQATRRRSGLIRVYLDGRGRINGALICLEAAAELINELSLAMQTGTRWAEVANAIHTYPSYGMALQQLAAQDAVAAVTSGFRGRLLNRLAKR
ncbi:MAG: dihydrolipoyl dehydrogenase family protein [Candidatus Dormibacter sp.]|uniref:dihydrolipoyl dehydrogenase family protein n=1 Tax=Candidatus Dormibacter sp. TaxID=2973982 RepID=UPI0026C131F8